MPGRRAAVGVGAPSTRSTTSRGSPGCRIRVLRAAGEADQRIGRQDPRPLGPQDRQRAPEVGVLGESRGVFPPGNKRWARGCRARLAAKHGKGKSLSIIAARLARAVLFMLKRRTPFDAERVLARIPVRQGTKGTSLNVLTGAAVQGQARPETRLRPNSLCLQAPQPSVESKRMRPAAQPR